MEDSRLYAELEKAGRYKNASRLYRLLARYGNPSELLEDVLSEVSAGCIFSHDDLALTPKYLIDLSPSVKAVIPLQSALWVFRMQWMFGKDDVMQFAMRIYTITGDTFTLKNRSQAEFDEIERVLTERYPNFFYGYSPEHEEMVHYILNEQQRELKELRKKES